MQLSKLKSIFMWARIVEILLGFWLAASIFIVRRVPGDMTGLINDVVCGLAVVAFGCLSFIERAAWLHFLTLAVGLWLIIFGYIAGYPSPATAQNRIIIGLLLAMFAIIPNRINEMPESWRKFHSGNSDRAE